MASSERWKVQDKLLRLVLTSSETLNNALLEVGYAASCPIDAAKDRGSDIEWIGMATDWKRVCSKRRFAWKSLRTNRVA